MMIRDMLNAQYQIKIDFNDIFSCLGTQPQRPLSHHSRLSNQVPTGEHHSSCASCSRTSQPLSLPRKGQKSSSGRYIRDNYLTMPTRPTTREDYRTEQEGHTSIRRGTSYHHLQGIV